MTLSSDECDLLVVGGGPRWFHRRDIRGSCRFANCRPAEGASGVGTPPPNAFAPLGFDSVNLLATAIERAGSTQPDAVRMALANTREFEGLVGKIAYSPGKRVPDKAVAVIKIDDGVETPVWTWMPQRQ